MRGFRDEGCTRQRQHNCVCVCVSYKCVGVCTVCVCVCVSLFNWFPVVFTCTEVYVKCGREDAKQGETDVITSMSLGYC